MKELKKLLRQELISNYSLVRSGTGVDRRHLKNTLEHILEQLSRRERRGLRSEERRRLIEELVDEVSGFGPIDLLFKDPQVTEIMVIGPDKVYAEKRGKKFRTDLTFDDEAQIYYLIRKFLEPTNRRVDELSPYTDLVLKDGTRVNILIPPISLDGPVLTIRKFLRNIISLDDLMQLGTLDQRMSLLLAASIRAKMNLVFAGATGSGKTTTMNVLSSYIADDERIVTIEDTAELRLEQEHVVRLEARRPNIEGKGRVTIRELFRNSLRMRPDRIILGEIRGAEALDMLQAVCSGHSGALSGVHASTPADVVHRLESMILTSDIPIGVDAIHLQIATGIDLIVQHERLLDGGRKVTRISQVNGMQNGRAVVEDIFVYDIEGMDAQGRVVGQWKATGVVPFFYPTFRKIGLDLPADIFKPD